jgi:hypothetical protein
MNTIFNDIEQRYAIKVIPAEIKGSRWSCLVKPGRELPLSQPVRIRINERTGYIIYPSSPLSEQHVSEISALLQEKT